DRQHGTHAAGRMDALDQHRRARRIAKHDLLIRAVVKRDERAFRTRDNAFEQRGIDRADAEQLSLGYAIFAIESATRPVEEPHRLEQRATFVVTYRAGCDERSAFASAMTEDRIRTAGEPSHEVVQRHARREDRRRPNVEARELCVEPCALWVGETVW